MGWGFPPPEVVTPCPPLQRLIHPQEKGFANFYNSDADADADAVAVADGVRYSLLAALSSLQPDG